MRELCQLTNKYYMVDLASQLREGKCIVFFPSPRKGNKTIHTYKTMEKIKFTKFMRKDYSLIRKLGRDKAEVLSHLINLSQMFGKNEFTEYYENIANAIDMKVKTVGNICRALHAEKLIELRATKSRANLFIINVSAINDIVSAKDDIVSAKDDIVSAKDDIVSAKDLDIPTKLKEANNETTKETTTNVPDAFKDLGLDTLASAGSSPVKEARERETDTSYIEQLDLSLPEMKQAPTLKTTNSTNAGSLTQEIELDDIYAEERARSIARAKAKQEFRKQEIENRKKTQATQPLVLTQEIKTELESVYPNEILQNEAGVSCYKIYVRMCSFAAPSNEWDHVHLYPVNMYPRSVTKQNTSNFLYDIKPELFNFYRAHETPIRVKEISIKLNDGTLVKL